MQMKTNFHMKRWAPGLAMKKRPQVIRKWPISQKHSSHSYSPRTVHNQKSIHTVYLYSCDKWTSVQVSPKVVSLKKSGATILSLPRNIFQKLYWYGSFFLTTGKRPMFLLCTKRAVNAPDNYRPISILPAITKGNWENTQVLEFFPEINLLSKQC